MILSCYIVFYFIKMPTCISKLILNLKCFQIFSYKNHLYLIIEFINLYSLDCQIQNILLLTWVSFFCKSPLMSFVYFSIETFILLLIICKNFLYLYLLVLPYIYCKHFPHFATPETHHTVKTSVTITKQVYFKIIVQKNPFFFLFQNILIIQKMVFTIILHT